MTSVVPAGAVGGASGDAFDAEADAAYLPPAPAPPPAPPRTGPFPRARRGTLTFLSGARRTCHVYLWADVDASRMAEAKAENPELSYISLVVKAAADVVADYPESRALFWGGRFRPRLAVPDDVAAKVLFDKTVDGVRCVVSGTIPAAQNLTPHEIQSYVTTYKNAEVAEEGPFRQLARIQKLPLPVARLVYRAAMADPSRRAALQGTFSVTSVGQEPVRAIFPMISGTLGFGVGRIAETALARDGRVHVAPAFTLSLAFDHRAVDGALASEVLARVKSRLENGPAAGPEL
ncbi:2-oxo acid dehydrogenase subunit E2 [Streptomyces sp. YIM 98790]|uniref:2-oxo acid dehydrogenase subunit E2 n=1 Tax=Streptomyces sp. YIM 98790 TaxID=2689077 RepID=UPI00140B5CE1|nr:2-oxo acid dehydrogenase subunit E2 [Streptomyces sp. YIM 98790]